MAFVLKSFEKIACHSTSVAFGDTIDKSVLLGELSPLLPVKRHFLGFCIKAGKRLFC